MDGREILLSLQCLVMTVWSVSSLPAWVPVCLATVAAQPGQLHLRLVL